MGLEAYVSCDGCFNTSEVKISKSSLTAKYETFIRTNGWVFLGKDKTKIYCPYCQSRWLENDDCLIENSVEKANAFGSYHDSQETYQLVNGMYESNVALLAEIYPDVIYFAVELAVI